MADMYMAYPAPIYRRSDVVAPEDESEIDRIKRENLYEDEESIPYNVVWCYTPVKALEGCSVEESPSNTNFGHEFESGVYSWSIITLSNGDRIVTTWTLQELFDELVAIGIIDPETTIRHD